MKGIKIPDEKSMNSGPGTPLEELQEIKQPESIYIFFIYG